MANTVYPLGAQKILSALINFTSDTIKGALVSNGYTYSTSHEFVSSLGTLIGTSQTLTGISVTDGVLDATDLDFGAIAPGSTIKALVIFKDTGNPATSPVLFYYDAATGLPAATNGGVITVPWSNDVKKIARTNLPCYPKAGEKILSAAIDMTSGTWKVRLLPSSYTYDAGHEFIDDVSAGIGTDQTLANKTLTAGVFDADDAAFGTIAGGSTIGSILIYKDTGTPATSPILVRFDDVVGLPYATNGAEYTQRWSNASAKIFSMIPA
jgi:hypothetical protein